MELIDQVLIPVETIAPGMFPSERAVKVRGVDDRELTLFVDERLIEPRGHHSYLLVTRLESDPSSGISVCLLPADATQGTRWVRIRNTSLVEAA